MKGEKRDQSTGPAAVAAMVVKIKGGLLDGDGEAVVVDACGRRVKASGLSCEVMRALGSRIGLYVVLSGRGTWGANGRLLGVRVDDVRDFPMDPPADRPWHQVGAIVPLDEVRP